MPEMTALGWFHTAMGITALVSGGFALARYKEITLQSRSGQIYLATTLITAATALGIFQRGEFGPGLIYAHRLTGDLIFTKGNPASAEPGILQSVDHKDSE